MPGAQFQFLTCPIYEALMHGTRGGGKTDTLLMSFAQHTGKGWGQHWRGVLFRLTYPQLADVVAKSRRWFSQFFPEAKFNKADYYWEWPTGEMLFFRYGASEDDYWNYHGHEYPWLGFEELTNWRDLSFYEAMQSTCRSSFPGMPRMVRGTCNPFGKGHSAVKERFKLGQGGVPSGQVIREEGEKPRVAIRSTIYENKILLANDPDYLATLEGLKDPNRRKAWLEGDWDIHVGSFLEGVWDAKRHVVQPFAIPASWKVWRSMDWGYAAPYAVYWFAMDPDGCIYIWRELYGAGEKEGLGSKEDAVKVAKKIKAIEEHDERLGYEYRMNLADPSIFANGTGQYGISRSIGQIFREGGVKWQPAWNAKGSRMNGAQEVIRLLAEDKLKVFSTCKHWLRTVPSLPPDDNNPEDVDSDAEDHCFTVDTMVMTNMGPRRIDSIGDALVLNDAGEWVPHENWRVIRRNAELVRVVFEDGSTVTCTPDHKFLTEENKYLPALDLTDKISYARSITCKSQSSATPSKSSTACATTAAGHTSSAKGYGCTGRCGSTSTAQCQRATTSTTRMKTEPTTNLETWSAWPVRFMSRITQRLAVIGATALLLQPRPQKTGTSQMQDGSGTGSTTRQTAKTHCTQSSSCSARCADRSLWDLHGPSSAAPTVGPKTSANGIRVIRVEQAGRGDTGCITVMERHNFALANGVIVANCWDSTRYGIMRRRRNPEEQISSDDDEPTYKTDDGYLLKV